MPPCSVKASASMSNPLVVLGISRTVSLSGLASLVRNAKRGAASETTNGNPLSAEATELALAPRRTTSSVDRRVFFAPGAKCIQIRCRHGRRGLRLSPEVLLIELTLSQSERRFSDFGAQGPHGVSRAPTSLPLELLSFASPGPLRRFLYRRWRPLEAHWLCLYRWLQLCRWRLAPAGRRLDQASGLLCGRRLDWRLWLREGGSFVGRPGLRHPRRLARGYRCWSPGHEC